MSRVRLHQGYIQTSLSPDTTLTSVILKMTAKHTREKGSCIIGRIVGED